MEPYGKITRKLTDLGGKVNYTAYRLATVLCLYANKDGKCWPSLSTLLETVVTGRKGIERARNELAEFGLKWEKRPNRSTVYEWDLFKMEGSPMSPSEINGGDTQVPMEGTPMSPSFKRNEQIIEQNMCKVKTDRTLTRGGQEKNGGNGTGTVFFQNSGETEPEKWTDDCTPAEWTARIHAFANGRPFRPSPEQLREWNRMRTPREITAEIRQSC